MTITLSSLKKSFLKMHWFDYIIWSELFISAISVVKFLHSERGWWSLTCVHGQNKDFEERLAKLDLCLCSEKSKILKRLLKKKDDVNNSAVKMKAVMRCCPWNKIGCFWRAHRRGSSYFKEKMHFCFKAIQQPKIINILIIGACPVWF